ncbi:MAG: hypothetical protein IKO28_00975 [Prevotella sp.]|nr:hypothetical protein [Prevotella sp.]
MLDMDEKDIVTLDFRRDSPDYVRSISTHAGLIPNIPSTTSNGSAKRIGLFKDEMPQTVITEAYNYRLDQIVLMGDESQTYIDNLRRTLVPDILPDVEIIKH